MPLSPLAKLTIQEARTYLRRALTAAQPGTLLEAARNATAAALALQEALVMRSEESPVEAAKEQE
jgi:hypothetical protein